MYLIQQEPQRFYILSVTQTLIGEIRYHEDEHHRLVVTHTYVDPQYRGQGIANQLLHAVIALAEQHKQYIYPVCSFAVKVLQNQRYRPLWDPKEGEPSGGACTWIKR
jgi:predicted GNAT family acetyltransferase